MWFMVQGKSAPERKNNFSKHFNDNRSIKVGLMGGSFNPVHNGHLFVAKTALKKLNLDELWWLISPQNPLKVSNGLKPINDRIKLTKNIARDPNFKVLSLEKYFKTSTTIDFLRKLLPRCPNMRFIWVMGSDNLLEFHKWKKPNEIVKLLPIAVFSRLINLIFHKPPIWGYIDEGRYTISSTKIRDLENSIM